MNTIKEYLIQLCNKLQSFCRAWNSFVQICAIFCMKFHNALVDGFVEKQIYESSLINNKFAITAVLIKT
ncbi:hypothetical protein BpHYR1_029955 [Brachionus plicatilis]|uniref:Uncharacterized protein n=1 Tax=Brachionus plicatilis TaxID=10195 RepID=A0A3M7QCA2_BRAPC|nr:hypothetical protein BpHYR1_029955 [Brachionus plicatilis]